MTDSTDGAEFIAYAQALGLGGQNRFTPEGIAQSIGNAAHIKLALVTPAGRIAQGAEAIAKNTGIADSVGEFGNLATAGVTQAIANNETASGLLDKVNNLIKTMMNKIAEFTDGLDKMAGGLMPVDTQSQKVGKALEQQLDADPAFNAQVSDIAKTLGLTDPSKLKDAILGELGADRLSGLVIGAQNFAAEKMALGKEKLGGINDFDAAAKVEGDILNGMHGAITKTIYNEKIAAGTPPDKALFDAVVGATAVTGRKLGMVDGKVALTELEGQGFDNKIAQGLDDLKAGKPLNVGTITFADLGNFSAATATTAQAPSPREVG